MRVPELSFPGGLQLLQGLAAQQVEHQSFGRRIDPYTPAATPVTPAAKGARVYNSTGQTTSSGVVMTLAFDSERWDTDGCHDPVTNNSRLVCNTSGVYVIAGSIEWSTPCICYLWVLINGASAIVSVNANPSPASQQAVSTIYRLQAGDYIELQCLQATGSVGINAAANYSPEFSMVMIGA